MGHSNNKAFDGSYSITEDGNYFKYKCSIPNFSLRSEKTGEYFLSPAFKIGSKNSSEWCLMICPNGYNKESKEYVSVFLYLISGKAKVRFMLSILNNKKEKKNIRTANGVINSNERGFWGFLDFVRKDFLLDKSNGLLINDELTILCEVEIIEYEYEYIVTPFSTGYTDSKLFDMLCYVETDGSYIKYKCSIRNFSLRSEKTDEYLLSPPFKMGSKDSSEWYLMICPNGYNEESKEYLSVFLMNLNLGIAITKFRFCILNDKEEEKKTVHYDHYGIKKILDEIKGHGFSKFIKKDFLINKSNYLLTNDKLTILCEAEIVDLENFVENFIKILNISKTFGGLFNIESDGNYFKYKCLIQNFSQRSEKTGKKIISPTCIIKSKDRSEWCLHIYPNGDFKGSKEYVSVFLILLSPDEAKAKFKLSILNDKEEEKNIFYSGVDDYEKNSGWGFSKFVKKDFLLNKSNGLLVNDNLTILCEAEVIDPNSGEYDCPEIIYPEIEKHDNIEIIDPKTKNHNNAEIIDSKTENHGNPEIIDPKTKNHNNSEIIDSKTENYNNPEIIDSKTENHGNPEIIDSKTENYNNSEIIDSKTENHDNPEKTTNITIPQSKLSLDYGNMLDSPLFYDCVVKVEDAEIQAHKEILARRSPVFYNIFKGTSDESKTNIIEIKDFRVDVVRKMLIYIYKDEVSDIQDMANEIFEIANKYELDRLKAFSEQSMCNSLTTDNVLERFALSDKYPTERLKECCEEIIIKNIDYLKETEEWEKYIFVRPLLLQSLLFKLNNIGSTKSNSEKKEKE